MMIIVRIYPKGTLDACWDSVLDNLKAISNQHCMPLYLSQRSVENFMTLVYDVTDMDSFGDILVKNVPAVVPVAMTRTITLLKPTFFPAPKKRPSVLQRYQVELRASADNLETIFSHILHLKYPNDAFPTYTAFSFGEDDILTSMLSTSEERLDRFVDESIRPQKGVIAVEIGLINRSKRVAPSELWKRYRESRYAFKPTEEHEEFDFLDSVTLPAAHSRELETSSFW